MENLRNVHLRQYVESINSFPNTVTIKMKDAALLLNEKIALTYGVDQIDMDDPSSWAYYMNIAGEYHFSNTPMYVVSIDTQELIEFTRENLKIHTATANGYKFGTRNFYALLNKYPDQLLLIKGILYPADKQTAIDADDGTILAYDKSFIEENEYTLIADLEASLIRIIERWYISPFNSSNELFLATFLSMLYLQIPGIILNLRLKRCHTNEVHSFHVRMFLASHGELDRYLPYLTLKQKLWLYRNIRYIERNSGRREQFKTLIDKLLTERGIPIGEYSVHHLDDFDVYTPKTTVIAKPLNTEITALTSDTYPVSEIFGKELDIVPGNADYLKYNQADDELRFARADSSTTQTKALFSSMVDYTNAVPDPLEAIALRQWCYMATKGLYPATVTFKDPRSSVNYTLSSSDALIYYIYVTLRADGFVLNSIPEFLNIRQRIHPKPSVEDLLSVIPVNEVNLRSVAEEIIQRQPVIESCFSVTAFYQLVDTLYQESLWHWFLISNMHDHYKRGYVENMVHRLYSTELTPLSPFNTSIESWRIALNLPEYDYGRDEARFLAKSIFEAATGLKIDASKLVRNVQKAMIELLGELSSYSVQFIREINDTDLLIIDWPAVRPGNVTSKLDLHRNINTNVEVIDANTQAVTTVDTTTRLIAVQQYDFIAEQIVQFDPVNDLNFENHVEIPVFIRSKTNVVEMSYDGQNTELENTMMLPGYTSYHNLPASRKSELKSIY